jgi:GLPGLI family protein
MRTVTLFNTNYQCLTQHRLTFEPSNKTSDVMKIYSLLVPLLFATNVQLFGQSSGLVNYEIVRKIDPSSLTIVINGEQVKPGDPNFPTDIPDTRTFGQKVWFTRDFVKESREDQNRVVRRMSPDGDLGGSAQATNLGRPFEEEVFVDLGAQKTITVLTIGKDQDAKSYKSENPIQRTPGWQMTGQTKKIAGYNCEKVTVNFRKETYTIWVTTELPFTYAPIADLTPEKGVALLIEGSREQYKATKVSMENVDARQMQPPATAQAVTKEQLADVRQKALADFRQKMMMGEGN